MTLKLVIGDALVEAHLAQLRLQQAESREWIRATGVDDNPFRAGHRLLGAGYDRTRHLRRGGGLQGRLRLTGDGQGRLNHGVGGGDLGLLLGHCRGLDGHRRRELLDLRRGLRLRGYVRAGAANDARGLRVRLCNRAGDGDRLARR
nr:hypothetical protein [Mycobacteroides abscessus]